MNKKKNHRQFGGECILDTKHYKCDEHDNSCINNVVDLLLKTKFKGNLSEESKSGGITEELKNAINNYYDEYEKQIEKAMSPECSGELLNSCYLFGCKMRAINNYYLLYKQYGEFRLEQERKKRNMSNSIKYGEKNETWKNYAKIPGW